MENLPGPDREGAVPAVHDPYAALRHRDFRLYLASNMTATIGHEMQSVTVGWELYERTGSAFGLGLVGLAQVVPFLLAILPAGQVADRVDRRRVLIAAQALLLVVSLGLAAVSSLRGPVPVMYALLGLAGLSRAFAMPARWAIVPQLVPMEDFANAVTWRSSAWQTAALMGPAVGGLALGATHRPVVVYLLDAMAGVTVIVLLANIRMRPSVRVREPLSLGTVLAGFRFVWSRELVLAAMTLDLFAVLLGGATALLPVFARDLLHVGPAGLGWLRAAPSVGAVMMGLFLAHRPSRRAGLALLGSVAGFGLATIGFGLSRSFAFSFAMLLLTGAFDNVSVVIRSTLVQMLTPDAMRGRVSAVNSIFVGMSNDLGSFESGLAARFLGPVGSVVSGGIGSLLVVLAVAWRWPQLAKLQRVENAHHEVASS
jgi:MFS family permease